MADVLPLVQALLRGRPLSAAEASTFFAAVVHGAVEPPLLAAAIAAIQVRGATAEELAAAAA